MHILNIASTIKNMSCQSMTSETLSLNTIIDKLDFLRKTVIIQ